MALTPIGDRVIVKREEAKNKSEGGIILPDTAKEKPQRGKVVAAGPGRTDSKGVLHPVQVKAGDIVLFGRYSGIEHEHKTLGDLVILREDDILAVDSE